MSNNSYTISQVSEFVNSKNVHILPLHLIHHLPRDSILHSKSFPLITLELLFHSFLASKVINEKSNSTVIIIL